MRQRQLWLLGLVLLVGGSLKGCASHPDPWKDAGDRTRVVVTFAPLESFVKKVGGDHVAVACLTTTTGPHHFDYRVKETIAVRGAQMLVASGLGLDDSFADKLHRSSANSKLRYLKLGKEVEELDESRKDKKDKLLIEAGKAKEEVAGEKGKHDHEHGKGHHHDHESEWDPHVWLGFASTVPPMIDAIRDELIKIDPDHSADYARNAAEFRKELLNLGTEAKKGLVDKKDKQLITFHDSMRYLARDLGLTIVDIIEISPGETPTSDRYKKLIELCQEKKIKYIATEPQYPESAAKILKNQLADKKVEVRLIQIDPLETASTPLVSANWYLEQMKKNLEVLKENLE